MGKFILVRVSELTDKYVEALQQGMGVSGKTAVIPQSFRMTKQISDILKDGGVLYYIDKNGIKTNLIISDLL